ncbi:MAG: purine-nucleoside phosphorylase [bacterium]|nr:purine-nucleoside phosphorylase [bacterium]
MLEQVKETTAFLKDKGITAPKIGVILGTGLGDLVNEIDVEISIDYKEIPNFPLATIEFHHGKLIYGKLGGKQVLAMQGRFHYYEGYTMQQVTFPVRVMKFLGVEQLLISNAAGGMNLDWQKGELMLLTDHINLQPENPLRGVNIPEFGPIFTDMSAPYSSDLNSKLIDIAARESITLREGVYVAVAGPNLETRAEYKFLRNAGADVVGMSTVPEVIVANQMELPCCAVSVITDECDPDNLHPVDIQDIINTAKTAEKRLIQLYKHLIKEL